jgi:hypothetical protein
MLAVLRPLVVQAKQLPILELEEFRIGGLAEVVRGYSHGVLPR